MSAPPGAASPAAAPTGAAEAARCRRLAARLALPLDGDAEAALAALAALRPVLTEWSTNPGDDPRGCLRFGSWVAGGDEALGEMILRLGGPALAALRGAVPHDDLEGLGLALRRGAAPTLRWWQLAPVGAGEALFAAALRAPFGDEALAAEAAALAADCGGPRRCAALGLELAGGAVLRRTIYFTLPSPEITLRVLGRTGALSTAPARRFFYDLVGVGRPGPGPGIERRWPKLWVGRSLAAGPRLGGWKLYWFARGAEPRPADEAILAVTGDDAGDGAITGARAVREDLAAEAPAGAPLVQLVGLTLRDDEPRDAPPAFTVYLAPR